MQKNMYKGRRQNLSGKVENDIIVLFGTGYLQKSGTTAFPFTQDSSFFYYTGINEPGWILIIDNSTSSEFLIKSNRSEMLDTFEGKTIDSEISHSCEISKIYPQREGWDYLSSLVIKSNKISTILPPPTYLNHFQLFTNPSRKFYLDKLKRKVKKLEIEDISSYIRAQRTVKDSYEISQIQRAIDITAKALDTVSRNFPSYEYENQIEADITKVFRDNNALHAYDPIVASGKRATTMHYSANNQAINGKSVLMDVGAEQSHYAADITRTYSVNTTDRYNEVYKAVEEVHEYALSLLAPGVEMRDYESSIEQFMASKLIELGLIKDKLSKSVREYYPHATSHFLGLDVHDYGDYENPIPAGAILTVEPGIYIPEEGIGVRIEDDIHITQSGVENLSKHIPRRLN